MKRVQHFATDNDVYEQLHTYCVQSQSGEFKVLAYKNPRVLKNEAELLLDCTVECDEFEIFKFILDQGVKGTWWYSLLNHCVRWQRLDFVKELIQHGGTLRQKEGGLREALDHGCTDIFEYLVTHLVAQGSKLNKSLLHLACTPDPFTIIDRRTEIIKYLVETLKYNLEYKFRNKTPFRVCESMGYSWGMAYLVEQGCILKGPGPEGRFSKEYNEQSTKFIRALAKVLRRKYLGSEVSWYICNQRTLLPDTEVFRLVS